MFRCGRLSRDGGSQGHGVGSSQSNVGAGRGRIFTVTQEEAQNSPKVVTDTLSLFGREVKVLFDSGATHSFVSTSFSHHIPLSREILSFPLVFDIHVGKSVLISEILRNYRKS
ncbi:hypothetical protein LIER_04541 [Lithospermum erythrorhizon]|uniref:Uncharacterized protein n=1 Tax=Lithospermum erythrorhizon TaxID=34254 RepID=A0AAV3NYZ2_LITER